jgi:hypothetical protein
MGREAGNAITFAVWTRVKPTDYHTPTRVPPATEVQ